MGKKKEKFKQYIQKLSVKERKKKRFNSYLEKVDGLRALDDNNLNYEYINLKTRYEYKKSVLTLLTVSVGIAIIMDVWKKFFSFMEMALQYASAVGADAIGVSSVSFIISSITALSISALIIYVLLSLMKEISEIKKELMIVEMIINERSVKK